MLTVSDTEAPGVLASPEFDVVPYAGRYAALAARLGLDFGAILDMLGHIPLCLSGADHAAQRQDVARLLGETRSRVQAALPGLAARHLAPLARPGEVELMEAAVLPLVDEVIALLVGIPTGLPADTLISRVFSQAIGVAQRRRLEAEAAGLAARLAAAFPDEAPLRRGSRLALAVLGRDALIGTVARSLHAHVAGLDGAPLSARPMPEVPSHTGVPYIDRMARADTRLGDRPVAAGEGVRCALASLEGGAEADRLRFFGAGPHVCLGRPLALELFAAISAHVAGLSVRVEILDYRLRRDDVFALPEVFKVRIVP